MTSLYLDSTFASTAVILVFELEIKVLSATVQDAGNVFVRQMIVPCLLIVSFFPNVSTHS